MSLRVWLVFLIASLAASAEVLAWAIRSGQFTQVNRANSFPLRATPRHPRHRPWTLAAILALLGFLFLVWAHSLIALLQ